MTQFEIIPIVDSKYISNKNSRWYIDKGHCDHNVFTEWFNNKYVTLVDGVGGRLEFICQVRSCTNCGLVDTQNLIIDDVKE